jgi:hypothetical protein
MVDRDQGVYEEWMVDSPESSSGLQGLKSFLVLLKKKSFLVYSWCGFGRGCCDQKWCVESYVTLCFWFCFAYLISLLIKMVIASLIGIFLLICNLILFNYWNFLRKSGQLRNMLKGLCFHRSPRLKRFPEWNTRTVEIKRYMSGIRCRIVEIKQSHDTPSGFYTIVRFGGCMEAQAMLKTV